VKKRILFIDHDEGRTGSTVSLEYLVKAFIERNYLVFILTPKGESKARYLIDAGAAILKFRNGRFFTIELLTHFTNTRYPFSCKGMLLFAHEILKFFWGILIIWKTIKKTSPQLVYVNEHVVMQASIAAHLNRIPAVIHIRSLLLKGIYGIRRRLISRLILTYNQVVFAITKIEAEQFCPRGEEREKIKVIGEFFSEVREHSADVNICRESFGLPMNRQIVAMLGGIEEVKGTLVFLQSARLVLAKFPNVVFVIAGETHRGNVLARAYLDKCMQSVEHLRQKGSIYMLGEITNSLDLIAASDIIVSPSLKTHFSRPIIEAWGLSKPIIASRTDHMQNLIMHGINGLLFDIGDQYSLAFYLSQLLVNVELCKRLGIKGKRKVDAEFNAGKNLKTIVDLCDTLIKVWE
jgi:glycosyltransferase involved in cell wall biosynthesis